MLEVLKRRIKTEGLADEVRLYRAGCVKVCKETGTEGEYSTVVIVYPEGTWYGNVSVPDVDEIVSEHVLNGRPEERLIHFSPGRP